MSEIPNILQCEYCARNCEHGGECSVVRRGNNAGCLAFIEDERGCIKRGNEYIILPLLHNPPEIGIWSDDEFGDVGEIRVTKYKSIRYKNNKLKIGCEFDYYCKFQTEEDVKRKATLILISEGNKNNHGKTEN